MTANKRPGRQSTGRDIREKHTPFFLTKADHESLSAFAKQAGFRSIGHLTTFIMESALLGGFEPAAFFRASVQLKKYAENRGASFVPTFYFGKRPEPVIEQQKISGVEWKKHLAALRKDIEQKHETME